MLKNLKKSKFKQIEKYVGTTRSSAKWQFRFLQQIGMNARSRVLEIGCGGLNTAHHLVPYLKKSKYVGVDPNVWLRLPYLRTVRWRIYTLLKKPVFSEVDNFDVSYMNRKFDFVISHSILSHAAHHQLDQFLTNLRKVSHKDTKILASIRLAEGNSFGSFGSPSGENTFSPDWVYPGVTFFKWETICEVSQVNGFRCEIREDFTRSLTNVRPEECHDWILFTLR